MQMFGFISIVLASVGVLAAQSDSAPVREHGYWTRTVQGPINASGTERLRVETTGDVQVRGSGDPLATYTMKLRVKAGDAREAVALFERFNVKTGTEGG